MPIPRELFVSHAARDRRLVDKIIAVLEKHGIPHWYSRKMLMGAQQWHDEVGAALKRCDWFLLVLSPAAVKSEWVKRELLYALDKPRFRGRIVPLLAKPCDPGELSWTLPAFQRVDFSPGFEKGCSALLRRVWDYAPDAEGSLGRRYARLLVVSRRDSADALSALRESSSRAVRATFSREE